MGKRVVQGMLVGLALALLLGAIGARAGVVSVPFERPDGASLWRASRAAGVAAYVALTLDVVFGLLLSTGVADAWIARARSLEVHRFLSAASLWLVAGHALVLLGDRYVRFDALDVAVPFLAPYRPLAVGLGVLAAYAGAVVHASFDLRGRLGARAWRRLHYLAFAVFALAGAHGVLAGTDGGLPWMGALYVGSVGLVLALAAVRALAWLAASATPPRRTPARSPTPDR